MTENEISGVLVNIFLRIHKSLGPGLLESVYEEVICYELSKEKISYKRQHHIRVFYEGVEMDFGFRADVIVEEKVIIEVKSVETLSRLHFKVLLTYLKLSNIKLGLLVNFNVELIKNGIHRLANKL